MSKITSGKLQIARLIGKLAKVETTTDIYQNYYVTSCELAKRSKLLPYQRLLLKKDSLFRGQGLYAVTAVCETPSGQFKQRTFFINERLVKEIGLDICFDNGSKKVILSRKFEFQTRGQYLWPMAKIFPRVQSISSTYAETKVIERINKALEAGRVRSSFEWRYQNRSSNLPRP